MAGLRFKEWIANRSVKSTPAASDRYFLYDSAGDLSAVLPESQRLALDDARYPLRSEANTSSGYPTLTGGFISDSQIPSGITRDSELSSTAAGLQPLDSDLTAIAALSTTAYGRSLLEAASRAALLTDLLESNNAAVGKDSLYFGNYFTVTESSVSISADTGYMMPVWLPTGTYDRIGIYSSVATSANYRLGLYGSLNGIPDGNPLAEEYPLFSNSTGWKEVVFSSSIDLVAGLYYFWMACSGALTVRATSATYNPGIGRAAGADTLGAHLSSNVGWHTVTTSMNTPAPQSYNISTASVPVMSLRLA